MNAEKLIKELIFKAVSSSGAGGQHVNKVSSKVELFFDLKKSNELTTEEKELLFKNLQNKLSKESVLHLHCDESRSQHTNKQIVTDRLISLLKDGIKKQKKRIPTKVSKSERARRLAAKKKHSLRKSLRQKPKLD